jgi:hypothetical protein
MVPSCYQAPQMIHVFSQFGLEWTMAFGRYRVTIFGFGEYFTYLCAENIETVLLLSSVTNLLLCREAFSLVLVTITSHSHHDVQMVLLSKAVSARQQFDGRLRQYLLYAHGTRVIRSRLTKLQWGATLKTFSSLIR